MVANVNFFSKVAIGEDGALEFVSGHSAAGARVTLRFELDTLVVLTNTPHPLDPAHEWSARPVRAGPGAGGSARGRTTRPRRVPRERAGL